MNIESLVRPNILALTPYSSARHEYTGHGEVFLDANENPYETGVNRYPDPLQADLKKVISNIKDISPNQIFLGNGSSDNSPHYDFLMHFLSLIFCISDKANDPLPTVTPIYPPTLAAICGGRRHVVVSGDIDGDDPA